MPAFAVMEKRDDKIKASVKRQNLTGIPTQLKERMEQSTGLSFDDVRVHYNSALPAKLDALAYTQGNQVEIGPGQERHLPHELGHVVQQKLGLVRANAMHSSGVPMNTDEGLERQADKLGAGKSIAIAQRMSDNVIQRCGSTSGTSEGGSGSTDIYRGMMKDAADGKPEVGNSARKLGVREGTDINVENGMVQPNTGGMSVSPSIEGLPIFRKPESFGGTGKDPVWKINTNRLGLELTYRPDCPTHGTIQPTEPMRLEDYRRALANTKPWWEEVIKQQSSGTDKDSIVKDSEKPGNDSDTETEPSLSILMDSVV